LVQEVKCLSREKMIMMMMIIILQLIQNIKSFRT